MSFGRMVYIKKLFTVCNAELTLMLLFLSQQLLIIRLGAKRRHSDAREPPPLFRVL